MKKTIYHDSILNFGKYKGLSSDDVLRDDPGYFLWCRESGTYNLDASLTECVDSWATLNGADANRVLKSARRVRDEKNAERGIKVSVEPASSEPAASVTHDLAFAKSAEKQEAWGTW